MEVLAIVRAHITALGGNAMVAFFMTQCVLLHTPHKNQVSKNMLFYLYTHACCIFHKKYVFRANVSLT